VDGAVSGGGTAPYVVDADGAFLGFLLDFQFSSVCYAPPGVIDYDATHCNVYSVYHPGLPSPVNLHEYLGIKTPRFLDATCTGPGYIWAATGRDDLLAYDPSTGTAYAADKAPVGMGAIVPVAGSTVYYRTPGGNCVPCNQNVCQQNEILMWAKPIEPPFPMPLAGPLSIVSTIEDSP
jgi:hypothetical protein